MKLLLEPNSCAMMNGIENETAAMLSASGGTSHSEVNTMTASDCTSPDSENQPGDQPIYSHIIQPHDPVTICDICGGCMDANECACDERGYVAERKAGAE